MSNNLNLAQITAAQTNKHVTSNTADGQLDAAITETLSVDFTSGNVSLTDPQFRGAFAFIAANLSAPRNLTVPAIKRFFFVNNAAGTAILSIVRGTTTLEVEAGSNGLFYTDGSANGLVQAAGGSNLESIGISVTDETTAIASTGSTFVTFRMPYAFSLTEVRANVNGATTTGTLTVDINEGGVSILSTKLTIDATEKTSTTAATPAVISDAALADDAEITVDLDGVGDGTATGLKIWLIGTRA